MSVKNGPDNKVQRTKVVKTVVPMTMTPAGASGKKDSDEKRKNGKENMKNFSKI